MLKAVSYGSADDLQCVCVMDRVPIANDGRQYDRLASV